MDIIKITQAFNSGLAIVASLVGHDLRSFACSLREFTTIVMMAREAVVAILHRGLTDSWRGSIMAGYSYWRYKFITRE